MNDDIDRLIEADDANVVPFPIDPSSRMRNDYEAELDQLAVRRKRPELTGCRHEASWVDIDARRVYCRRCEAELDPFDVLEKLARNREFLVSQGRTLRFECDRRARELEELKRKEANAKARVRRAEGRTSVTAFIERYYPGEWCKRCDRSVTVGFQIPDEVWAAVVQGRFSVVCLPCFDELSAGTGIEWEKDIVFYPVSRATWDEYEAEYERPPMRIPHDKIAAPRRAGA